MRFTFAVLLCCAPLALPAQGVGGDTLALSGANVSITIRALSSTLEFVPAHISARTGVRLRIRFVNEGTYPHNFVLAKKDDDIDDLAAAAAQAAETGFVPLAQRDKIIAFTRLISPGETGDVEFIVPAPGQYTFICLFPGHTNSMIGTLRSLSR